MNDERYSEKRWGFEDSFEGAVEFLKEETDLNVVGARGIPDPVVDGCWLIHLPEGEGKENPCSVAVWLNGSFEMPSPDFEVGEYQPDLRPNYP